MKITATDGDERRCQCTFERRGESRKKAAGVLFIGLR